MSRILIVGGSGTVGSHLAPALQRQGHDVLVATRTPRQAQHVQLDLLTGQGLEAAVQGVERLFLMAPPGHVGQQQLLIPVIDAARAYGVKQLVLMSAMGADADPASGLRIAELHLEGSGLAYSILRPNWFMQNFHTFWMGSIAALGEVQLPVGDAKASFIDARDIAAVAATLLHAGRGTQSAFDLTGPEAIDHATAAALISAASGRTIGFRDIAPQVMRGALITAGLGADYADFLLTLLGYLKAGYAGRTTTAVRDILGREPARFETYAKDYAASWQV